MSKPQHALPSPPSSRSPSSSPSPSPARSRNDDLSQQDTTLSSHLDNLLIRYLDLLDTYTTLRSQLSRDFSSGFLSLAQANRTSNLGAGRRYGEEGYDERMKSLRTVVIAQSTSEHDEGEEQAHAEHGTEAKKEDGDEEDGQPTTTTPSSDSDGETSQSRNNKASLLSIGDEDTARSSTIPTDLPSVSDSTRSTVLPSAVSRYIYTIKSTPAVPAPSDSKSSASTTTTTGKTTPINPLNWYGILIPPALRQTQSHFTSAVTSTIPELVSAVCALQGLEDQIRRARGEISRVRGREKGRGNAGEGEGEEGSESRDDEEEKVDQEKTFDDAHSEKRTGSDQQALKTKVLPGRSKGESNRGGRFATSEPRSRLLKLE